MWRGSNQISVEEGGGPSIESREKEPDHFESEGGCGESAVRGFRFLLNFRYAGIPSRTVATAMDDSKGLSKYPRVRIEIPPSR